MKKRGCEKEKKTLFFYFSQSVSNETNQQDESEEQPSVTIRKQTPSNEIRSNRKSMFEQSSTPPAIERVNHFIHQPSDLSSFLFLRIPFELSKLAIPIVSIT